MNEFIIFNMYNYYASGYFCIMCSYFHKYALDASLIIENMLCIQ